MLMGSELTVTDQERDLEVKLNSWIKMSTLRLAVIKRQILC